MFCARCGAAVAPDDKDCTSCGASLRRLGSVRMTSISEPVPDLDEIFPEMAPEPEPEPTPASPVPARTVAAGPVRLTTRGWTVIGVVAVLVVLLVVLALS